MLKVLAMIGIMNAYSSFTGKIDPVQLECMARAVYSEARGEPVMGQAAVAWGIKHRMDSKDFPNQACDIIYDERFAVQFPHIKDVQIDENSAAWESAVEVSALVWAGFVDDPIDGRRFWYNPKKAAKPRWLKMGQVKKIGNHVFYDKAEG
mgnify:CR=1 FL=1